MLRSAHHAGWYRRAAVFVSALVLVAGGARLATAEKYEIVSPDKDYRVELELDKYGRPEYSATFRGKTVLRPSRMGLELESFADFSAHLRMHVPPNQGSPG